MSKNLLGLITTQLKFQKWNICHKQDGHSRLALKTGKRYGILLVIEVVIEVTGVVVVGKGTTETAAVYNLIITDK